MFSPLIISNYVIKTADRDTKIIEIFNSQQRIFYERNKFFPKQFVPLVFSPFVIFHRL